MPRPAASWTPLVDRGDVLAGNRPADDGVGEAVPLAGRQRLEPHMAVPELPAAPRLFLVPAVAFGLAADRFPVRDARLARGHFDVVETLEPLELHVEVQLAHPPGDGLPQLGDVLGGKGGVLLVQLVQPHPQLVLVAARRALDRYRDVR